MTKTRSTAELEEPQAKHQSRPVDERVAEQQPPPARAPGGPFLIEFV